MPTTSVQIHPQVHADDTRDLTQLLHAWSDGDRAALEELMALVYDELRQIAGAQMRRERQQTWQPTVLVHEVYLRLSRNPSVDWNDRRHFFAVAARTMRRLLVDRARRRGSQKRGGGAPVTLSDAMIGQLVEDDETLAVDEALVQLYRFDSLKGWIVELRFFGGYSLEETAEVVGISRASVVRQWRVARAWLYRALRGEHGGGDR